MRMSVIISGVAATLLLSAPAAMAQSKMQSPSSPGASAQGKFCLKGSSGAPNCTFATMAACEQAKKGKSGQCEANANASTTGAAPSKSK